jgi:hypothetical protein
MKYILETLVRPVTIIVLNYILVNLKLRRIRKMFKIKLNIYNTPYIIIIQF